MPGSVCLSLCECVSFFCFCYCCLCRLFFGSKINFPTSSYFNLNIEFEWKPTTGKLEWAQECEKKFIYESYSMFQPNSCSSRCRLGFFSSSCTMFSSHTNGKKRRRKISITHTYHMYYSPTGTILNSLSLNQIEEHTQFSEKSWMYVCLFVCFIRVCHKRQCFVECEHICHIDPIQKSVRIYISCTHENVLLLECSNLFLLFLLKQKKKKNNWANLEVCVATAPPATTIYI